MPDIKIARKLLPFLNKQKRFKIAIGGRGSGKSMTFADLFLLFAQTKRDKIACFREYQNSIDDSVLSLLEAEIDRLSLVGFKVQQSEILYKGSDAFKFKGLARNPEAIKSMYGFNKFWVEEAQTISYKSLKVLTPTLREEGSEIWMSGNRGSSADPFSQRFIVPFERDLTKHGYYEDDLHLIVVVNHSDNPFFPEVLERDRVHDKETMPTAEYLHIWEGYYNDEVEGSIIPVDWFNAAIDAHIKLGFKPIGAIKAAFDPSDQNGDPKGFCLLHGSVFLDICDTEKGDVNDGCDWAIEKAIEGKADYFIWDCDGLGAALKRDVSAGFQGKNVIQIMFKGSESVDEPKALYNEGKPNEQVFRNKRSQYYWRLRDRFYNTYRAVKKGEYIDPDNLISISSEIKNIDSIRAEICRIPEKKNNNMLKQIKSKEEMRKMQIPSPNMADCMMQAMHICKPEALDFNMNFAGWAT